MEWRGRTAGRSAGVLAVVVGGVLLVMAAAALSGPKVTGVPLPLRTGAAPTQGPAPTRVLPTMPMPTTSPPAAPREGSSWLGILAAVIGLIVLVALVIVLWHVIRRLLAWRRTTDRLRRESLIAEELEEPAPSAASEALHAAVESGLSRLADDDGDPRAAVIMCWLSFEAAAAQIGIERRPEDTPRALVGRVLAALAASAGPPAPAETADEPGPEAADEPGPEAAAEPEVEAGADEPAPARDLPQGLLDRFAELYRWARFAPAEVDERMRAEARETLEQLRGLLGAEAVS